MTGQAHFKFLAFFPTNTIAPNTKRPVIIFLHGAAHEEDLGKFKHYGPIREALRQTNFPFVAISPASARGWPVRELNLFWNSLRMQYPGLDWQRVYLSGYSMGAHATWAWAAANPRQFAAIVPIAGAGNPEIAPRLRHLPVWVFHGDNDTVVPVEYGRQMIRALQAAGGKVKFTIYPSCGHMCWLQAFQEPELYAWMLKEGKASRDD